MQLSGVDWTDLFVGGERAPLQVVRVTLVNQGAGMVRERAAATVRVEGAGVTTPQPVRLHDLAPGAEHVVEVPVAVDPAYAEDTARPVTVIAETGQSRFAVPAEIVVAAPGWTMLMVSHFHYDPVWWNTQGAFTEAWYDVPEAESVRPPELRTAFDLVRAHLTAARHDPDYKFVLAEVDYLKPHWDTFPEDRADLRHFIAEGRVEIVGGNYNEPNTNLTCTESTIRNAVYGIGFQRDVVGGDPRSAWMLDVFGHDPAYPGLMADAGLTSSSWARGPFHQWGPRMSVGDNRRMEFPSEFEWISPSGRGLLTSYMPNHYSAGWSMESLKTLEQAEAEAYRLFRDLKVVAATRFTMLPVGNDHVIPSRWCTEIHRDWNKRYLWPRFQVGLPREFFAAVRQDAAERRISFTPQSRDMNPVYTGKDVSYIDTKQAQRAAEVAVLDGERLATLATLLGARFPAEALDKAWRQLLFNAHHDGITGTESDQVYIDLLGGWREAYELGDAVRGAAIDHLGGQVGTAALCARRGRAWPVLAVSTLSWPRDGLARVLVTFPEGDTAGVELSDDQGAVVPALAEGVRRHPDGSLAEATLTFLARAVPALGYRTYLAVPADTLPGGWSAAEGVAIENEVFRAEVDPQRGGALTRVLDKRSGKELLRPGAAGNELVLHDEYEAHPRWAEGPWHLLPKGPGRGSAGLRAAVRAERCPLGGRLVSTWTLDELRVSQEVLLWDGVERADFRTHVDGSIGQDRLLRVRFPLDVAAALPVYEVGNAVVGRPFGFPNEDSAEHPWALDNPASTWFGLSSTARVALTAGAGASRSRPRRLGGARPRPHRPARRQRRDGDLHAPGRATLRGARSRLQPARRPDRPGRPGAQRLRRERAAGRRPGLRRAAARRARRPRRRPGLGARGPAARAGPGARRGPARGARPARADRRRRGPRRGDRRARRRPRRLDRGGRPAGRAGRPGHGAGGLLGGPAQPRHALIGRRGGRHPLHLADALVQRMAVRDLARPAAPHRARRLELRLAALEPHLPLRPGGRPR